MSDETQGLTYAESGVNISAAGLQDLEHGDRFRRGNRRGLARQGP